jgi:NADH-quinone oxidoreductase subunit L
MDEFYEKAAVRPVISGADWLWTFADVKVVDGAVNGIAWLWARLARVLRPLQTGRAQNYAFGILIGVLVLVVAFRIF